MTPTRVECAPTSRNRRAKVTASRSGNAPASNARFSAARTTGETDPGCSAPFPHVLLDPRRHCFLRREQLLMPARIPGERAGIRAPAGSPRCITPHDDPAEHRPRGDLRSLQPSHGRGYAAQGGIGGSPLPLLVAFRAHDPEQPRNDVDGLDDILDLDRHQYAGAQSRIVSHREQRLVTQIGKAFAKSCQRRPNIQPTRAIGERILDRPPEPQRPRLLLRHTLVPADPSERQLDQFVGSRVGEPA